MLILISYEDLSSKQVSEEQLKLFAEKAGLQFVKKPSGRSNVFLPDYVTEGSQEHQKIMAAAQAAKIELSIVSKKPLQEAGDLLRAAVISLHPKSYFGNVSKIKECCTLAPDSPAVLEAGGAIKVDMKTLEHFTFARNRNALFASDQVKDLFATNEIAGLHFWPCEDPKQKKAATRYWAVSVEDRINVISASPYLTLDKPLFTLSNKDANSFRGIAVSDDPVNGLYTLFVRPKIYELFSENGIEVHDWQIPTIQ